MLGRWSDDPEKAVLDAAPGKIVFRFLARDLHLVLGPARRASRCVSACCWTASPRAPITASTRMQNGNGVIREQRLYQLIRQTSPVAPHTFSIEFLDAGAQAYSFTFG